MRAFPLWPFLVVGCTDPLVGDWVGVSGPNTNDLEEGDDVTIVDYPMIQQDGLAANVELRVWPDLFGHLMHTTKASDRSYEASVSPVAFEVVEPGEYADVFTGSDDPFTCALDESADTLACAPEANADATVRFVRRGNETLR